MRMSLICLAVVLALGVFIWLLPRGGAGFLDASQEYVLQEADSPTAARDRCLKEAAASIRRQAAAILGGGGGYGLTADEMDAFLESSLAVETVRAQPGLKDGRMTFQCQARAPWSPDAVRGGLKALAGDPDARRRLLAQRNATAVVPKAAAVNGTAEPTLREQREAQAEAVEKEMRQTTQDAADLLEKGMSAGAVVRVMGPPDALKSRTGPDGQWQCAAYGRLWVVFKDGLVRCARSRLSYDAVLQSDCHCSGLSMDFILQ